MANGTVFGIDLRKRGRDLAIYVAIGVFLTLLNPFGATAGSPLWMSALYWISLVVIGAVAGEISTLVLNRAAPQLSDWVGIPIIATCVSIVILPSLLAVEWASSGRIIPAGQWPRSFGLILVVAIGITTVATLIRRVTEASQTRDASPAPAPPAISTFMDRLPVRLRSAQLYAVQSEDHYLRVHTSAGQEMILMRLADAIRELASVEGMQTHRSWWVAREGLAETGRDSGRLILKLKSGAEAPVSRTYQAAVRAAGWI